MKLGALYQGKGRCKFVVWAPSVTRVDVECLAPHRLTIPLEQVERGYWRGTGENLSGETLYRFVLDAGKVRPDPASNHQPSGVHEASQIVDHAAFAWEDASWQGIDLARMVMYELHVGTFTPQGTFEGIVPRLDELKELGINTIEIMPVAQFPGERNWGYDGVYPFAVQNSYGGPAGLKSLVNECHKKGIAVILDVVYNHLGPEGNYLADFGPYFTDKYRTPWGRALNFDGPYSDEVRNYFIENAIHWFDHYHIDALRLDAIHAIYDMSAHPFLQELAEGVERFSREKGRKFYLIAESNLNDSRVIRPREIGGYGHDAQWCDDFHHIIHTLLTRESNGYYVDYGTLDQLVKCLKEGFIYSGQYSRFRMRHYGNPSADRPAAQFVVCTQNHDQIGNRMLGERLSKLISFEALKLASAALLLSPYVPLIFMGQEYAEDAPFLYFVSHSDPDLVEAVRKGRREEFRTFQWDAEPPDPQGAETFLRSRLQWDKKNHGGHRTMFELFQYLLELRRTVPALSNVNNKDLEVMKSDRSDVLMLRRWFETDQVYAIFNFSDQSVLVRPTLPVGTWRKLFDSSEERWGGNHEPQKESISGGEEIQVRPYGVSMFRKEE